LIVQGHNSISKILIPFDGSENAEIALKYAASIAREADSEITLLNVIERSIFRKAIDQEKNMTSLLSETANDLKGLNAKQRIEHGSPGKTITQLADKEEFDLIVIGSKGQSAKRRFLMGSVSSHVIHYANRSVLLVPIVEKVKSLSQEGTIKRLVNLHVGLMGSVGSYMRETLDEERLRGIFEYQSEKFSQGLEKAVWSADEIAKNMIRLNFQPYGMEAKYHGNSEKAAITVTRCPLPEKFLKSVEFLRIKTLDDDQFNITQMFASPDRISSTWEWPPKKTEVCGTCRVLMPLLSERLGFKWKHRLTDDKPPLCVFDIETK
jgi:nucleotide-binding universal stress UspA family protein